MCEHERLACGLQAPANAILDRLGRVRLGEHCRQKEVEKAPVVAQPIVLVVPRPAFVGVELVLPGVHRSFWPWLPAAWICRADEDGRLDPLWMVCGEHQRALCVSSAAPTTAAVIGGTGSYATVTGGVTITPTDQANVSTLVVSLERRGW